MVRILVTGVAGFIGFHTAKRLLEEGEEVLGIDIMSDYYDIRMKEKRLELLKTYEKFTFKKLNFADYKALEKLYEELSFEKIIHLGAQAGVRYSLENPWAYAEANYLGAMNIFELARRKGIKRVVYASTSSVYGDNVKQPFSEEDRVDTQISVYAATKKANEVLAYSYHHLYGLELAGLRFFTVYGTYGRPDLALFKFVKNILLDKPIDVYNNGDMKRDFTYVEDVVTGVLGALRKQELKYEIYNIGGDNPTELMRFIELIEENLGKKAEKNMMGMQAGDVKETVADVSKANKDLGYVAQTKVEEGVKIFCDWFIENKDWLLELKDPGVQQ
jgi:UDP-glucuronate 4-epimerase